MGINFQGIRYRIKRCFGLTEYDREQRKKQQKTSLSIEEGMIASLRIDPLFDLPIRISARLAYLVYLLLLLAMGLFLYQGFNSASKEKFLALSHSAGVCVTVPKSVSGTYKFDLAGNWSVPIRALLFVFCSDMIICLVSRPTSFILCQGGLGRLPHHSLALRAHPEPHRVHRRAVRRLDQRGHVTGQRIRFRGVCSHFGRDSGVLDDLECKHCGVRQPPAPQPHRGRQDALQPGHYPPGGHDWRAWEVQRVKHHFL